MPKTSTTKKSSSPKKQQTARRVAFELSGGKKLHYPSVSSPGRVYTVMIHPDGKLTCNCPAWIFKKATTRRCVHTYRAALNLGSVEVVVLNDDDSSVTYLESRRLP